MHYTVRPIEWDSADGEEARRIRLTVFVDEQKVPIEEEIDAIDPTAHHVLAVDESGHACGTGRIFPDPKEPSHAHIGRVAVSASARGTGCGMAVLNSLIEEARRAGYKRAVLSSQTHAMGFYERAGFRAYGDVYMDAGIPHRDMDLDLTK
ncbi:GNAT family N-acetyltransferase [bacterium]|nr:GNAT family N-acetyltransferase [bacterium]